MSDFRSGNVSDPVHGYIAFTGLEREIIDHPVTQRLRYVSQTGMGHLVYPELRSSRFAHCLGAMHLSSLFFAAALRNSEPGIRDELVRGITVAVEKWFEQSKQSRFRDSDQTVLPVVDESDSAIRAYAWFLDEQQRRALAFAEKALRLTALFHDLGHLPFSHDFEFALDELRKDLEAPEDRPQPWVSNRLRELYKGLEDIDANKFHEVVGPEIGHLILRDILKNHGPEDSEVLYKLFDFAFDIWTAEEPHEIDPESQITSSGLALSWLKSIVSGQLDVDRCDYILRDGRNYSFVFASYDLDRLLGQLVIANKSGTFVLAVRPQGTGFLESFVLARYRSYQFGVLHHKVSQVAAALQYSIGLTIRNSPERGSYDGAGQFLQDLGWLIEYRNKRKEDPSKLPSLAGTPLQRFANYDDLWWTILMRQTFGPEPDDPWVALVLWRSRGPLSLWKRVDDFTDRLGEATRQIQSEDPTSRVPSSVSDWNEHLQYIDKFPLTVGNAWHDAVRRQRKEGVLVLRKVVKPFKLDEDGEAIGLYVHKDNAEPVSVTTVSPLARSLRDAWNADLQIQAFASGESEKATNRNDQAAQVLGELWNVLAPGGREEKYDVQG